MPNIKRLIHSWLPVLFWMGTIFYFSSKTKVAITQDYWLSFAFFKTLHLAEYAFLYFLLFRAFYHTSNSRINKKVFVYAFIVALLYGVSDEIHQLFVPTREGRIRDVLIDTLGIFLMYIYIKKYLSFVKKII